jgi:hypothetical protein
MAPGRRAVVTYAGMKYLPTRCRIVTLSVALSVTALVHAAPASAQAPPTKLRTKWAADVTPARVLPEYPRPQMQRADWVNLNGPWDYAIADAAAPRPQTYAGKILVPFAVQSQLRGVAAAVTEQQRLWYRRMFRAPSLARGSPAPPV